MTSPILRALERFATRVSRPSPARASEDATCADRTFAESAHRSVGYPFPEHSRQQHLDLMQCLLGKIASRA